MVKKKNSFFYLFLLVTFRIFIIFGAPQPAQRPVRLSVRTPDFHSGKMGSTPIRVAISMVTSCASLTLHHRTAVVFLCLHRMNDGNTPCFRIERNPARQLRLKNRARKWEHRKADFSEKSALFACQLSIPPYLRRPFSHCHLTKKNQRGFQRWIFRSAHSALRWDNQ